MIGAIIAITIGAGALYLFTVSSSTVKTLQSTYANVGKTNTTKTLKATKPLTILLMGVDTGGLGRGSSTSWDGNSDSQIIMTLNPKTDTTTMVSMERDTMTNILDSSGNKVGNSQKMNAAYPLGYNAGGLDSAVSYAMKTIGAQSGININNFVVMNFDGLINLVNDVGGIDVVNDSGGYDGYFGTHKGQTITLPVIGKQVASGAIYISDTEPAYTAYVPYYSDNRLQHINGEQALVFARDRHTVPGGDYGRIAHQRDVLSAVMKKILALDNLTQYQKFLKDISQDFKTNIPVTTSTLTSLLGYKDCFKKIVSIQYQGVGETVNGGSYQFTPQNVYLAIQNNLRHSLGESTINTLDSNLITYESYFGTETQNYLMPSATVTENGKSKVYGINIKGDLVSLNSSNAGEYVSVGGTALTSSIPATENSQTLGESTQASSSNVSDGENQ